jgi:hypothetical protein
MFPMKYMAGRMNVQYQILFRVEALVSGCDLCKRRGDARENVGEVQILFEPNGAASKGAAWSEAPMKAASRIEARWT